MRYHRRSRTTSLHSRSIQTERRSKEKNPKPSIHTPAKTDTSSQHTQTPLLTLTRPFHLSTSTPPHTAPFTQPNLIKAAHLPHPSHLFLPPTIPIPNQQTKPPNMCISLPTTPKSPQHRPTDKTTTPRHNNNSRVSDENRIALPNLHRSIHSTSGSGSHNHSSNPNKVVYRNIDEDVMHSSVSAFAPVLQHSSTPVASRREQVQGESVPDVRKRRPLGRLAQRQVERKDGGREADEKGTEDMRSGDTTVVESRV